MICGYINGTFCEQQDLKISAFDLGLLRGCGVFEHFRTYQKQPFFLSDRLKRLAHSATSIGIPLPKGFGEIETIIKQLLLVWKDSEATIRIIITGGISADGMSIPEESSLLIFLNYLPIYPQELYEKGIAAITSKEKRFFPQVKTLFYVPAILLLKEAKEKGAQEILHINEKKEILEGTTSNFMAIKANRLIISRNEEILSGITRAVVVQLAQNYEIEERNLPLQELDQIEEAFLTSSIREIVPLVKINQTMIGSGKPGPKTKALIKSFHEFKQKNQVLSSSLLIKR